ncbi:MAG: hypothetical protein ACD_79C01014G0006 [uncultured bacterium]|nr:MAG: hypothetical protein ACD_79C01014G0006 [uncultured bacterium]
MIDYQSWSIFEYGVLALLLLYFLKGFFRSLSKNVFSLILLPLTIIGYFVAANLLAEKYILPNCILGTVKILLASFAIITVIRFIVFVLFNVIYKTVESKTGFLKFVYRFPGAFISFFEGFLIICLALWSLDYFDNIFSSKYGEEMQKIFSNPVYVYISKLNPIYDVKGSKDVKIVLTALTDREIKSKLADKKPYKVLASLPSAQNLYENKDVQEMIQKNEYYKFFVNNSFLRFIEDEDIFKQLTSDEFIAACAESCPADYVKHINERKGILNGLLKSDIFRKKNEFSFQSDTKIKLKNGFKFEGQLKKRDENGLTLKLPQGELYFKNDEIADVRPV